jgi:hypothetical protein
MLPNALLPIRMAPRKDVVHTLMRCFMGSPTLDDSQNYTQNGNLRSISYWLFHIFCSLSEKGLFTDESTWVVTHLYMEAMLGIFLYSYP